MRKNNLILLVIVIIIILAITGIIYWKNSSSFTEQDAKCVASKSTIYVSKTCSACARQKEILGNFTEFFNMIDCGDNPDLCSQESILRIPTWDINEQRYVGIQDLKTLKKIAGC